MKKCNALVILLLSALLAALCSGCKAEKPLNVAVVAAVANQNPVVDAALIDELQELPTRPGSQYAIILADGQPRLLDQDEIVDLRDRHYASEMMDRIYETVRLSFEETLAQAAPAVPEVDMASAIQLASQALEAGKAAVPTSESLLVVYASGISTTSCINMVEAPVKDMDAEAAAAAVADYLKVDLSGTAVILYGIGETAGTQSPLSPKEVQTLKSFYEKLFLLMHAKSVTFRPTLMPEGSYDFPVDVSCMPTEGVSSVLPVNKTDSASAVLAKGGIVGRDIRFSADSTEFLDEAEVREQIADVVTFLKENPEKSLIVCGTTARDGSAESCRQFSLKRAIRVAELLREQAAPEQVSAIGVGFSSPFYEDEQINGWDESIARTNRSVKFLLAGSSAANSLLDACSYLTEERAH